MEVPGWSLAPGQRDPQGAMHLWEGRLASAGGGARGKLLAVLAAEETQPVVGSLCLSRRSLLLCAPAPVAFLAVMSDHPGSACLRHGEDVPDTSRALHTDPWVPAARSWCRSLRLPKAFPSKVGQRRPSASQPRSSQESFDFFSILLKKSFQIKKILTNQCLTCAPTSNLFPDRIHSVTGRALPSRWHGRCGSPSAPG